MTTETGDRAAALTVRSPPTRCDAAAHAARDAGAWSRAVHHLEILAAGAVTPHGGADDPELREASFRERLAVARWSAGQGDAALDEVERASRLVRGKPRTTHEPH